MTLRALAVTTAVGSAGLAAGGTASPLLAADLRGTEAAAGLPLGVLVAGSAAGALLISRETGRRGRGRSLSAGYALGALGALVVVVAASARSFAVLLGGCLLLGAANSAVFLTRYAAADAGQAQGRGRAIGSVLTATAVGAVAGPNLLGPAGAVARAAGLPRLSGLFLLAAPAFAVAALALWRMPSGTPLPAPPHAAREAARQPGARRAFWALAAANLVMVAVMAVAPTHMVHEGRGLGMVGLIVSIHVAGMFGPSPLTGRLADRVGGAAVAILGLATLAATAGVAVLIEPPMIPFLAAVGLGWNAALVGASALLAASVPASVRPLSEGLGEVAMGLAAGAGAPGAGLLMAFGGFRALGAVAAPIAAVALFVTLRVGRPAGGAPAPCAAEVAQS